MNRTGRSLLVLLLAACGHAAPPRPEEPATARTLLDARGTLMGRPNEHYSQCNTTVHGMGGSVDAAHAFTLEERSAVVIEVDAEFPTPVISVVGPDGESCGYGTLSRTLPAGDYQLFVESRPAELGGEAVRGAYAIVARAAPVPDRASICAAAASLGPEATFELEGPSAFDVAPGPERLFALHLDEARRVQLHAARPDGLRLDLAVLTGCSDDGILRRSGDYDDGAVSTLLPAGDYFVLVEAEPGPVTLTYQSFVEAPGSRACTEAPLVDLTSEAHIELETFTAADTTRLACGSAGAPDVSRRIHVERTSELTISARSIAHHAVVGLGTDCRGPSLLCFNATGDHRVLLDPGDYFVTVEGANAHDVGVSQLTLALRDLTEEALACASAPHITLGLSTSVVAEPSIEDLVSDQATGAVYVLEVRERARFRFTAEGSGPHPLFGLTVRTACLDPRASVWGPSSSGAPELREETELAPGTYYVHVWMTEREALRPEGVRLQVDEVP